MTKKIFLSGIYHETHTFLSQPTTLNDFIINIGDDIIKENKGNGSPTDGFIEFALQKNWDIISGKEFGNITCLNICHLDAPSECAA